PSPFEPAKYHRKTHSHHVASLQLQAFGHAQEVEDLDFFSDFAIRAGYALGIPLSKVHSLKTTKSLWTVPKGPFVHKKSQENFERRTNRRLIKVWDADVEVVEKWLHFLRIHAMEGVGMRAEVFRH
ncbi:ribosomal protein S10, partial [Meira miltonrushii]